MHDEPNPLAAGLATGEAAPVARSVDALALQRTARRLRQAAAAPWLHAEVARRMAERLGVVRMQPPHVLDWGARVGGGGAMLAAVYPQAAIVAVEPRPEPGDRPQPAAAGGGAVAPWWSPRRWRDRGVAPVLAPDQLELGGAQLVWANMVLHGVPDPLAAIRQWHRALAVDGFLMFSTFGPGSLAELRAIYQQEGWGPPMAPLVDMHDLGDMLVESGFADPVMDQEQIVLTWDDAEAALSELRLLGANVHPRRRPGLRTPRWRERLLAALRRTAGADGRVRLGFEIAYGHAFRPPARLRAAAEVRVELADLRAMAQAGRRSR